jgi:hypothetical protein
MTNTVALWNLFQRQTTTAPALMSALTVYDISRATLRIFRVNGSQVAISTNTLGTGNYGNAKSILVVAAERHSLPTSAST